MPVTVSKDFSLRQAGWNVETTSQRLDSLKRAAWLVKVAKPKHTKNSTKWVLTRNAAAVEQMHEQYFNPSTLLEDCVCCNTIVLNFYGSCMLIENFAVSPTRRNSGRSNTHDDATARREDQRWLRGCFRNNCRRQRSSAQRHTRHSSHARARHCPGDASQSKARRPWRAAAGAIGRSQTHQADHGQVAGEPLRDLILVGCRRRYCFIIALCELKFAV